MTTKSQVLPLPLVDLRERMSNNTYQWIKESEEKDDELKKDEALGSCRHLFHSIEDDEDEEEVNEWISSSTNIDGYGGYFSAKEQVGGKDDNSIKVKYILSEKAGGHGDDLWAASRYIANIFANPSKCCELLSLEEGDFPLLGCKFLELGAGGGVPSWVAMKCGAQVVCTDQSISHRIRCLAESAQRNLYDLQIGLESEDPILFHAKKAKVCPYDWGSPIDEIISLLDDDNVQENQVFDIVLAADCVYMPQCHDVLLDSIKKLLAKSGVALLPFALHGNTKDENIWNILEKAKEKGFDVEVLETVQLTPQAMGMDEKRGLVNMVRMRNIC